MVSIQDILSYFLEPYKEGYTVAKTMTFAAIFVVAAYAIYEILKRLEIKIDKRLALAVSPYVVLGGIVRVLVDNKTINSFPLTVIFTTPNIYIVIAFLVTILLSVSVFLERRKIVAYHKLMFMMGAFAISFTLIFIKFVNLYGIALVSAFILPWMLFAFLYKKWRLENRLVLLCQMLDANTTFVTLNFFGIGSSGFGYVEQHVLPTFLMNLFGPFSFVIVKAAAIIAILLLIDRYSDDRNFNNYIKLIIGILGAATGGRDFLRLANFV